MHVQYMCLVVGNFCPNNSTRSRYVLPAFKKAKIAVRMTLDLIIGKSFEVQQTSMVTSGVNFGFIPRKPSYKEKDNRMAGTFSLPW